MGIALRVDGTQASNSARAAPSSLRNSATSCCSQLCMAAAMITLLGANLMLGKLSIIGAVAAIFMIPTGLSAQMGGAVNPGVHVGGTVNPGATVRGAVERGIPGPDLGTWRSPSGQVHRKHSKPATKQHR